MRECSWGLVARTDGRLRGSFFLFGCVGGIMIRISESKPWNEDLEMRRPSCFLFILEMSAGLNQPLNMTRASSHATYLLSISKVVGQSWQTFTPSSLGCSHPQYRATTISSPKKLVSAHPSIHTSSILHPHRLSALRPVSFPSKKSDLLHVLQNQPSKILAPISMQQKSRNWEIHNHTKPHFIDQPCSFRPGTPWGALLTWHLRSYSPPLEMWAWRFMRRNLQVGDVFHHYHPSITSTSLMSLLSPMSLLSFTSSSESMMSSTTQLLVRWASWRAYWAS